MNQNTIDLKVVFITRRKLTLFNSKNKYVIGFYLFHGIPIEHAWVNTPTGYVDSTLDDDPEEGHLYYSVYEIDSGDLSKYVTALGDGCITLSDLNRYLGRK